MTAEKTPVDYSKPVAYDVEGKPLYAHPPVDNGHQEGHIRTQAVHIIRPTDPEKRVISEAVKLKHEKSHKAFPDVHISESEYIISSVPRHWIGLFLPAFLGLFLTTISLIVLFNLDVVLYSIRSGGAVVSTASIVVPTIVFIGLVVIATCIAYYVYISNKFLLTNESIIQEIQTNISKKVRIVSLADIEDVSYTQSGILQQIFNYGSIRLSTEGEGTIYRFSFVRDPKSSIANLSNAVEAFKNGRAIDDVVDLDSTDQTDD